MGGWWHAARAFGGCAEISSLLQEIRSWWPRGFARARFVVLGAPPRARGSSCAQDEPNSCTWLSIASCCCLPGVLRAGGGPSASTGPPPRGAFCPARCRSRVSGALRAVEQRIEEVCWCRLCPPSVSCYQSHGVLQNQRRKRPPLALSHKEFRLEQGSESEPRNNPRPPQPCVGAPDFSPATQEPKLRVTEQLSHKREPG